MYHITKTHLTWDMLHGISHMVHGTFHSGISHMVHGTWCMTQGISCMIHDAPPVPQWCIVVLMWYTWHIPHGTSHMVHDEPPVPQWDVMDHGAVCFVHGTFHMVYRT